MSELDSVSQTLKEQEEKLIDKISQLEEEIAKYQGDLERVQGAISALDQKPKQVRKKRKAQTKPSVSRADVEAALMEAKDQNPDANDDQIRSNVEEILLQKGFSKSGLALRMNQVLEPSAGQQSHEENSVSSADHT